MAQPDGYREMIMAETIGFLGLGNLGRPIVSNLMAAGYELAIFNRDTSKVDPFVEQGAVRATRPADVVRTGGVVLSLLWDDASVEAIVRSEDFLTRLGGGVHVSMTTLSPEGSRRLMALHAEHGSVMVEAPIFGRPDAAVAKKLWIVTAGQQAAKDRVRPILEAAGAQGVFDFGEQAGAALAVKLIGNMLIISATASLREGLAVAQRMGVDPQGVVDMLTTTLFPAPIYQSYGRLIAQGGSRGDSAIPVKDVGLFKTMAEASGVPANMSTSLLSLYE
jgi:3-hydroxyisobutyrate dehydrogenase-like beta-hydroxyacid dehydrogenase